MSKLNNTKWTNGSYTIQWSDIDQIRIDGPYSDDFCLIDGGDFERILYALIMAYNNGYNDGRQDEACDAPTVI